MLVTSSDTKRTLMHLFLFTNSSQRELVSICVQSIRNAMNFPCIITLQTIILIKKFKFKIVAFSWLPNQNFQQFGLRGSLKFWWTKKKEKIFLLYKCGVAHYNATYKKTCPYGKYIADQNLKKCIKEKIVDYNIFRNSQPIPLTLFFYLNKPELTVGKE